MAHQFAKPRGWIGRWILHRMNRSHSDLTDWGLSHIEIPPAGCILDVGCGGGRTLGKLAARSERARIFGIDHSPESVWLASKLNARQIEKGRMQIQEGSVSSLPYADGAFNLVTAVETHFFWPNLDSDVREVFRVIRPGGVFAIIAEAYKGAHAAMTLLMEKQAPETGLKLLTPEQHIDLLCDAEFEDVQAFTWPENGWICVFGRKPSV